uniref:Protein kinase domain-containing protein n=1 Tax=viral metagenome TaxID=1070528 RepID=A0A6C0CIB3_9ZZZZ
MRVAVLCSKKGDFEEDEVVLPKGASSEFIYLPNLQSLSGEIYDAIVVACDISKWEEKEWNIVKNALHNKSFLFLQKSSGSLLTSSAYRVLREHFWPAEETKVYHSLLLSEAVTPEIVSPEEISKLMKEAKPLEQLFRRDNNPAVCPAMDHFLANKVPIGRGREGAVYFVPEWWSEVVIKKVLNVKPRISDAVDGAYTGGQFGEVMGASLLTDLLDGTSDHGFLYHIQRYAGFFSCKTREESDVPEWLRTGGKQSKPIYDLYLINEKMDGDLRHFLEHVKDERKIKVGLWQAIFALTCLNKLQYFHHDSSPQNFLYRSIHPDETFLGAEVGASESWTYKLSDEAGEREWKILNARIVVKTTDFSFMRHLMKPQVLGHQDIGYRVDNSAKGFADINYFLIKLMREREVNQGIDINLDPLFSKWFELIGIDESYLSGPDSLVRVLVRNRVILPTLRFPQEYDDWNPLELLSGEFFADILLK